MQWPQILGGMFVGAVLTWFLMGSKVPPGPVRPASEQCVAQVRELVRQGRKLEAIKLVRKETGMGLKETKDYVDELER